MITLQLCSNGVVNLKKKNLGFKTEVMCTNTMKACLNNESFDLCIELRTLRIKTDVTYVSNTGKPRAIVIFLYSIFIINIFF